MLTAADAVALAKPRKLLSLQYNYSDSEDEETREDRKARIVSCGVSFGAWGCTG